MLGMVLKQLCRTDNKGMVLQQLYKNELVIVSELVSELVIQLCSY